MEQNTSNWWKELEGRFLDVIHPMTTRTKAGIGTETADEFEDYGVIHPMTTRTKAGIGTETADEFEDYGKILITATVYEARRLRRKTEDEESDIADVYIHFDKDDRKNLRTIAALPHPWWGFLLAIKRKIIDKLRAEGRYGNLLDSLEGDDDEGSIMKTLAGDPATGTGILVLFRDDIRQVIRILRKYRNQAHADMFLYLLEGWRIIDIAEEFKCTPNQVQLAIGYVGVFVLKMLLKEEQVRTLRILKNYPDQTHLPLLSAWVEGETIERIGTTHNLSKSEVQLRIGAMISFLAKRWFDSKGN